MTREARDIMASAITAVSSTDSGSGGDDATFVTAINAIITALENEGIVAKN